MNVFYNQVSLTANIITVLTGVTLAEVEVVAKTKKH